MNLLLKIFSVLCFLTLSMTLEAQINTDRPNQSISSVALDRNDFQIESGLQTSFSGENASTVQWSIPNTQIRYGLVKGLELRLFTQLELDIDDIKKRFGISDLIFGTKIQLVKKSKLTMLLQVEAIAPIGSAEFTNGIWGGKSQLAFTSYFPHGQVLDYNIGYNNFGTGKGDLLYTLSYTKSVNSKFSFFTELYGQFINIEDPELNFDSGILFQPNPNGQFDASFGIGFINRMNFFSIGYSWLIKSGN